MRLGDWVTNGCVVESSDMDSTRQALRWSIPGLIFVLEVFVFSAAWQVVGGRDLTAMISGVGAATAVATLVAGVPLGFLLYQLYYRNYRPHGRSVLLFLRYPHKLRHGWAGARPYWTFVRRDRGADILRHYYTMGGHPNLVRRAWERNPVPTTDSHYQIRDVTTARRLFSRTRPRSLKVLTLAQPLHQDCTEEQPTVCGRCRAAYSDRFRWNWAVVMAMLDYAGSKPDGASIKFEYAAGSDIYHALGAARTAIATAATGSIGYQLMTQVVHQLPADPATLARLLFGGAAITLLAYVQYQVIHSAREQSSTNMNIRTAAGLSWFSRLPEIRDSDVQVTSSNYQSVYNSDSARST